MHKPLTTNHEPTCYHLPVDFFYRGTERMGKQAALRTVDLEPIDRLGEKIKLLVALVTRLRAEQAEAGDEKRRLTHEISAWRARRADWERVTREHETRRGERAATR